MRKTSFKINVIISAFALVLILLALSMFAAAEFSILPAYASKFDQTSYNSEEYDLLKAAVGEDAPENYKYVNAFDTVFGKILRFQQVHLGKTVEGAQITVTADKNNNVLSHDGRFVFVPNFSSAEISLDKAVDIVVGKENCDIVASDDVYFYDGKQVFDVYKLYADNFKTYYVSKQTGNIVYSSQTSSIIKTNEDAFKKDINIDVAYENGKFLLKDDLRKIYIIDAKGNSEIDEKSILRDVFSSSSGEDFDPLAVTVYDNMIKTYDFYSKEENIGTSLVGITNKNNNDVASDDYSLFVFLNYSSNKPTSDQNNNAYFSWGTDTQGYIYIGNGTQNSIGGLYMQGKAFDVIAHEYQHGVTRNIVNLRYEGESGALDEAFSDIFGSIIEGNNPSDLNSAFWTIGENGVYNPNGDKSLAIRSLKGGTKDQIYSMDDKFVCKIHTGKDPQHSNDGNCDYNGVHYNSTIISHIQYELSALAPQFFTRERIGTLWFTTLLKLSPTSGFIDFANAFFYSAVQLGYSSEMKDNILLALSKVGLNSDDYKTVSFINTVDNSLLYYEILDDNRNYFIYNNIKDYIQSDKVTSECTYKFKKLQNKDGSDFDESAFNLIRQNLTVYVSYSAYCTATFLDVDGNVLFSEEYEKNSKITPPDYSTLNTAQYYFHGWYTRDMDEVLLFNFENSTLSQNMTFLPKVTLRSYIILFYTEDSLITKMELTYGKIIPLPDNETVNAKHDGYILEGWYFDPQLTNRVENISVTKDLTLYAKWVRDEKYYQTRIGIIVVASLAIACIILIPIIVFITKRRRRK